MRQWKKSRKQWASVIFSFIFTKKKKKSEYKPSAISSIA